MDGHAAALLVAVVAALWALSAAHPADPSLLQTAEVSADKRPKYMDTRELDLFKDLLLSSLREMAEDGQINPAVFPSSEEATELPSDLRQVAKRIQYMGICMRRRHNTFIPYPCLRSGSK